METVRSSDLFAHRIKTGYQNFFKSQVAVGLCGSGEIVRVRVTEDPEGPYYGWWCNRDHYHTIIFNSRDLVEMCFPYGSKVAEELGEGKIVRLRVEEREDAHFRA